jgi:hypothetical protein
MMDMDGWRLAGDAGEAKDHIQFLLLIDPMPGMQEPQLSAFDKQQSKQRAVRDARPWRPWQRAAAAGADGWAVRPKPTPCGGRLGVY